jgi:hypothetical protein
MLWRNTFVGLFSHVRGIVHRASCGRGLSPDVYRMALGENRRLYFLKYICVAAGVLLCRSSNYSVTHCLFGAWFLLCCQNAGQNRGKINNTWPNRTDMSGHCEF